MTTIAYRDGLLAADTMLSDPECRLASTVKVSHVERYLLGAAGNLGLCSGFIRWITKNIEEDLFSIDLRYDTSGHSDSFGALVVQPGYVSGESNERLFLFDSGGRVSEIKAEYFALGSGTSFAIGAMAVGADALAAVRAGIKHDVWSQAPIDWVTNRSNFGCISGRELS